MTDKHGNNKPPHLWKPGVSGNPRGRPKSKHALSEAIRAGVDPAEMVERALAILRSPTTPASVKIQMWTALADRGWARPPAERELTVTTNVTPTIPSEWATLSAGEKLAYLEQVRVGALSILDEGDDPDGYAPHVDESQVIDIAPVADDMEQATGAEAPHDDDKSNT